MDEDLRNWPPTIGLRCYCSVEIPPEDLEDFRNWSPTAGLRAFAYEILD